MRRASRYTRRSFPVDKKAIRRARRALGAATDAEVLRLAIDRVVEMEEFWRFLNESRSALQPGSVEAP